MMTATHQPTGKPAFRYSPHVESRWATIQALRASADRHLAVIATDAGPESRLAGHCRAVWSSWEREALISILHRDYANAEVMLDRGVHALRHALDVVRKDRLTEDEMVSLITAS
jgi:hypothetical protein